MIATLFTSCLIGFIALVLIVFFVSIADEILPVILIILMCTLFGYLIQETLKFIF